MKTPNDGRELLAQYRRAIAPSRDQLAEVWTRLDATERPAQRRGVFVLGLGATAAAALLLAWWGVRTQTAATAESQTSAMQAQQESAANSDNEPWTEAPPRTSPPSRTAPPPAAPAPSPVPQRPAPRAVPPATSPDPAALRLAAEAKLIRKAEAQLRASAFVDALRTLETHGRVFPAGALSIERRALRSIALCNTGNLVQGRGEAAALRRDPASAPYGDRIAKACK